MMSQQRMTTHLATVFGDELVLLGPVLNEDAPPGNVRLRQKKMLDTLKWYGQRASNIPCADRAEWRRSCTWAWSRNHLNDYQYAFET
jgi:hypothetical protein